MDSLVTIYNTIVTFFDSIGAFLTGGLYDLLKSFASWFLVTATIEFIHFKIWFMQFSWDVAKDIITGFGFTEKLNAAIVGFDARLSYFLTACRIPESVNIVFTAYVSKYVMRFYGF